MIVLLRIIGHEGFNSQSIVEKVIELEETEDATAATTNFQQHELRTQTTETTKSSEVTAPCYALLASAAAATGTANDTRIVNRTQQQTNSTVEEDNSSRHGACERQIGMCWVLIYRTCPKHFVNRHIVYVI